MHQWAQLPATQVTELEESGEIMPGSGYQYKDETTGVDILEYHVDTGDKLNEWVTTHLMVVTLASAFP